MPKSAPRRKRIRTARAEADPTSLPESKASNNATVKGGDRKQQPSSTPKKQTAGQERDKQLGPVLQKLSSDSADDRLWATAATSHILSGADSGTRRALQSKNIVGLLINLLDDAASVEVQAETCGALRNLAIEGGAEVCAEMYNKSIVPKLATQLSTVSASFMNYLKGIKASSENEVRIGKVLWIWIEHLATLFWCLAETSDKAFKAIVTIQPLSDLLYEILKQAVPVDGSPISANGGSRIPASVALAAAQAVYVLTDVNVPSAPKFPLPRDVSKSAAYINTRSMLLESLRNLTSSFESSSASSSKTSSTSLSSAEASEQLKSLLVMIIGIYQNLSLQKSFGKSASGPEIEAEEQEFTRLTLRILASLISQLDIEKDATSAIEAYASLPSTAINVASSTIGTQKPSSEAVQISPQRKTLDLIEGRWTSVRLALEILGEIVAGVDGLLDPALLGEEEYEEWNGISDSKEASSLSSNNNADGDMNMDAEDEDTTKLVANGSTAHHHHHHQQQQQTLSISTDIRTLLSSLPSVLMALGKPSRISFTSPSSQKPSNATKAEENLISTQIDMADDATSSTKKEDESLPTGTYIPSISEVFSFVHVRALECLNNLLITLARSNDSSEDINNGSRQRSPDVEGLEAERGDMDEDEDEDGDQDLEGAPVSEDGTIGDATIVTGENYVTDNMSTFQKVFEDLFHTLVDYQGRYQASVRQTTTPSSKNKDPCFESLELAVEASVGCIWALSRLCGNLLTVGRDEHRLLLSTLDMSLSQPKNTEIAIRCIGALGQLAMRSSVSNEENESIGSAFISQLKENELSKLTGSNIGEIDLVSQILDTLFDVYGDETRDYEGVVDKLGLVRVLEAMLPTFKRLTKSVDKRKYPETRTAAEAALLNLPAYVKYRKDWNRKKNNM